jgi:hypothetical protein
MAKPMHHTDHPPDYISNLAEMAAGFPEARRRAFLGDQVRDLSDIPVEARAVAPA